MPRRHALREREVDEPGCGKDGVFDRGGGDFGGGGVVIRARQ
jgi:uncharacterized membrane protein YgcG